MGCGATKPAPADARFIQDLDSIPHAGPYEAFDAILRSVESGAVAPLKGSWLLALYEGGGRLRRRQELPKEAFWTADELHAIVDAAHRHFKGQPEKANAALGHLFAALSYRWLAKGQPDPDGFHLERVANFLYSYLGRGNPKFMHYETAKNLYIQFTPLNTNTHWRVMYEGGYNNIDQAASLQLIAAMKGKSMESIGMARCKLGEEGAKAAAEMVSVMPSLTRLEVENNLLGEEGEAALRKATEDRSRFELFL